MNKTQELIEYIKKEIKDGRNDYWIAVNLQLRISCMADVVSIIRKLLDQG